MRRQPRESLNILQKFNTWKDFEESFLELERPFRVGRGGLRGEAGKGREKRERESVRAQGLGNSFKPVLGGPGQPL